MSLEQLIKQSNFKKPLCICRLECSCKMYDDYNTIPKYLLDKECDEEVEEYDDCVEIWVR